MFPRRRGKGNSLLWMLLQNASHSDVDCARCFLQHKRRYTAKSLRRALTDAGLRVEWVSNFNVRLLPLAVLARLEDRLFRSGSSSGTAVPAAFVNRALLSIFRSERRLLDRFDLPAGVSMLAVVRWDDGDA